MVRRNRLRNGKLEQHSRTKPEPGAQPLWKVKSERRGEADRLTSNGKTVMQTRVPSKKMFRTCISSPLLGELKN